MSDKSFNLTTEPWLYVIDNHNNENKVSLFDLFENAQNYRQLAGEMKSQDLAILRFLLAILLRVYTSEDADEDEAIDTWEGLYQAGHFDHQVADYLKQYQDRFDLFGDHAFYQVSQEVYDQFVEPKKRIAKGKGTVAIKQIDRTISESNHTPDIFSPRAESFKNKIQLDQLARWLITYQNYAGATDKTKIVAEEKFSIATGWLYGLNPVYVDGDNLFEILLYNLKLMPLPSDSAAFSSDEYYQQKPVWEYEDIKDYIQKRSQALIPTNLAELYTDWSRLLHIEWSPDGQPTIFSAGLPKINNAEAFIEPMTTWKLTKKDGQKPAMRSKQTLNKAMWRSFGQYLGVLEEDNQKIQAPGVVSWIRELRNEYEILPRDLLLNLVTVGLVSDGNATSQSPAGEFYDGMKIQIAVFSNRRWTVHIEEMVKLTQKIVSFYWYFAKDAGSLIGTSDPQSYASRQSGKFYQDLNRPFLNWLQQINADDNRSDQDRKWKEYLYRLAEREAKDLIVNAAPAQIVGNSKNNIFTLYNQFQRNIYIKLKKE